MPLALLTGGGILIGEDTSIAVPFHLVGEHYILPLLREDRVHCD